MKDIKFLTAPSPTVAISPDDNDLRFANGDVIMVEGHERKFQDVAKILLTRVGSDSIIPTYGSQIPNIVGNRAINVEEKLTDGIVEAMAFLVQVEESNKPSEIITGIKSLTVETPPSDPRQRTVKLDLSLSDGQVVQSNVRI